MKVSSTPGVEEGFLADFGGLLEFDSRLEIRFLEAAFNVGIKLSKRK